MCNSGKSSLPDKDQKEESYDNIYLAWRLLLQELTKFLGNFSLQMTKNKQNCCHRTFHSLAKEFRKEKFNLDHDNVNDFLKSQVCSLEDHKLFIPTNEEFFI